MNDQFSLEGKVVAITGATGILGQSFIDAVTDAGGTACIIGRKKAVAEERAQAVISKGGTAMALVADVTDQQQLEVAASVIAEKYGRLDGLVNAAGGNMPEGVLQHEDDIFDMNLEGMKKVMDINLWGPLLTTQVFGKLLLNAAQSSIVNISSMNSKRAITKVLGYNMGKAAIDCYTQWFAVELANRHGDKIRMNALAPGFFLTEQNRSLLTQANGNYTERGGLVIQQTPFKRFGQPKELEGALVWLLSDASRFVTGSMICVDGGFSIFGGV